MKYLNEQFMDSVAAAEQHVENGQTFIHVVTSHLEHPITDLTLWICPNTTGAPTEASKPAFPNDASYWHRMGAKPEASTPARAWTEVVLWKRKSTKRAQHLLDSK